MAREQGADVIVDAAHSFRPGCAEARRSGADFVGCNLHKWIGAPVGVGVMSHQDERIGDIDRMMADESNPATSIDSRIHSGTTNFATCSPCRPRWISRRRQAQQGGAAPYLRDRWVRAVRDVPGIQVLTPDDRDLTAGISSFHSMAARAGPTIRRSRPSCSDSHSSSRSGAPVSRTATASARRRPSTTRPTTPTAWPRRSRQSRPRG